MLRLLRDKNMQEILFSNNTCIQNVSIKEIVSSRVIDDNLEEDCKKKWLETQQKAQESNSKIWDSEIYRFENIVSDKDELTLIVSTIPFSVRLALNSFAKEIMEFGEKYRPMGMFFSIFDAMISFIRSFLRLTASSNDLL